MLRIYPTLLLSVICSLVSCTPRSVLEAQLEVSQADSVWRSGHSCTDSSGLAMACQTLHSWQWFYADEYAHACYHYGRLLRKKDDPLAAMQVFIHATHSHTRDYHILGRVYSNMGSLCHLAGEFPLAYDMYAQSADCFLKNGDSLNYFYALNDMAYELAEQGKKEETLILLDSILKICNDEGIIVKTWETKAEACLRDQQYDSAIYYTSPLLSQSAHNSDCYLIRAQAFSMMGLKDSAVYYANLLLLDDMGLYSQCNALYILTNDDETQDVSAVRKTAANRADTQKLIENQRSKLSQAVQLLEQDLHRKPDLRWLLAIVVTLVITGCCISLYVYRKRRRNALLSQKVKHLETVCSNLETRSSTAVAQMRTQLEERCVLLALSDNLKENLCWGNYEKMCHIVDEQFYLLASKLRNKQILNETEIRLCVLVMIGLSRIEISNTLPYALNSIGKLKDHTAKLLGTTGKNLKSYLFKMAIEE